MRQDVVEKIFHLAERIEDQPKSLAWRLRAAIGTRMRWYDEVGDVHRGAYGHG
jgi:hypothetical protein